ncbi:hypothetical protein HPB48_005551 [Haemaphysalis longicornis]|uniref:Calcineurin-like phosphoesterase domain-containing protein n=1 Tax=Haemaphysalis longicornis TaxID=44386 RepID=A0A9J6H3T7_HAELO|nr:hypothetical protein HPB48_005551 [Haemaphysalis longicornis]
MDLLKRNSNPVSMSLLVGLLWLVCYMQSITSTEVCTGLVKTYKLSDTHYDPEYAEGSLAACDEPLCCRLDSGEVKNDTDRAGRWGDLRFCDLPFRTLDNMLEHIGRKHNLDFAYWTGDLPPHDVWKITREANTKNFNTTTAAIFKRLRGLPVYPVVGNHESVPPNM